MSLTVPAMRPAGIEREVDPAGRYTERHGDGIRRVAVIHRALPVVIRLVLIRLAVAGDDEDAPGSGASLTGAAAEAVGRRSQEGDIPAGIDEEHARAGDRLAVDRAGHRPGNPAAGIELEIDAGDVTARHDHRRLSRSQVAEQETLFHISLM
jgi:hypothetical protein